MDPTWLIQNAEGLGIVSYLVVTLVIGILALHRRWIVIGWMYSDKVKEAADEAARADKAEARADALQSRLDSHAERVERKLEILEEADRRSTPARKRGSSQ